MVDMSFVARRLDDTVLEKQIGNLEDFPLVDDRAAVHDPVKCCLACEDVGSILVAFPKTLHPYADVASRVVLNGI